MARVRIERNISFDEDRQRYYVNFEFGKDPETGKQIKKTKTFEKITQARAALRKHEAARGLGQVIRPQDITVGQWLTGWMNNVTKINRADTTVYAYQNIINLHIIPALGNTPIQTLSPPQLQSYYAMLIREKGLSTNTVRKHHDLLNTALEMAVKQGLILSNPAKRVESPKIHRPEIHYYSLEELKKLLELCKGTKIEVLVKLAGLLGLRREEILGLTWDHVDFQKKKIEIVSVRTAAGKTIVTKEPKTTTSTRTLHMPSDLEDALLREQEKQHKLHDYLKDVYHDEGYVFTYDDGRPMRPNYASDLFTRFIKKHGLPHITLHGLRHTFATMSLENGMDVKTLSTIIGHVSSATTLNTYTHVTDEMRQKAAVNIDRGIAKAEVQSEPEQKTQKPHAQEPFTPVLPARRRPGTGYVKQIKENLWEWRYSPVWPDGKKHSRNVYGHTEAECEEKLKELILQMKAEIAALRSGASTEYPDGVSPKKKAIAAYLRAHPGVTNKAKIARDLNMGRTTVQRYYDEVRAELRGEESPVPQT